jgi:hypothetical protein
MENYMIDMHDPEKQSEKETGKQVSQNEKMNDEQYRYEIQHEINNLAMSIENPEHTSLEDPEGKFWFARLDPEEHPPVHFEIT